MARRFLNRAMLAALAAPALLALGACESSTRLGSLLPEQGIGSTQRSAPQSPPPPLTAAPSAGEVESSSLPAPGSAPASPALPSTSAPAPSVGNAPGNFPSAPSSPPPAPQVAAAPTPQTAVSAPTRTGLTGNWGLTESAGARCRVTLSSAPKLDLYGAATNGCQAKELQRVNAWELAGSEVILYEPGGGVVARLRQAGAGTYTGVSTRSGAPVTMTK